MLTIETIKAESENLIEQIKRLPKEKQEFISGYIQGILDMLNEAQQAETA